MSQKGLTTILSKQNIQRGHKSEHGSLSQRSRQRNQRSSSSHTQRKNINNGPTQVKNVESIFTVDYSPRSKFLQKLRANGRVIKISPKESSKSLIRKESTKRKTVDVGTDPPSYRLPKYKDVGTDPPDFSEEISSNEVHKYHTVRKKKSETNENKGSKISESIKNNVIGSDLLNGLVANECHGQYTFDCPKSAIQELKDFRQVHWFDCHGDANTIILPPNHACIHNYILNERLLPQPLSRDSKGRSLCRNCGLTAAAASKSKHKVILESVEDPHKKTTFEIPNPQKTQPVLRHTVESRGKINISSVPTMSFVPHFPQKEGRHLKIRPGQANSKASKTVIRHTVNCKTCCTVSNN